MVKLYATLGPACADESLLAQMLSAGADGLRLNLSHMTLKEAEPWLRLLHEAEERSGRKAELLIDAQGPELRTEKRKKELLLSTGEKTPLSFLPAFVRERMKKGQEILLDDGKLLLRALSSDEAEVLRGGTLKSRKSIALPGLALSLPALTDEDRSNLAMAPSCGVNAVMQPFVRGREDLDELRSALDAAGGEAIGIFAKIENRDGLDKLPELMERADMIVIARGDLGNTVPLWQLPTVQKQIAARCRAAGKPFLVVTQMLASMEQSPVPTRAEMSDVFNAVLDGASAVMLTNETAAGRYPVEAVAYCARCVAAAEAYRDNIM